MVFFFCRLAMCPLVDSFVIYKALVIYVTLRCSAIARQFCYCCWRLCFCVLNQRFNDFHCEGSFPISFTISTAKNGSVNDLIQCHFFIKGLKDCIYGKRTAKRTTFQSNSAEAYDARGVIISNCQPQCLTVTIGIDLICYFPWMFWLLEVVVIC